MELHETHPDQDMIRYAHLAQIVHLSQEIQGREFTGGQISFSAQLKATAFPICYLSGQFVFQVGPVVQPGQLNMEAEILMISSSRSRRRLNSSLS